MPLHEELLESVNKAPDGPQVAAIFDFDGTLIAGFSVTEFLKEQLRRGHFSGREIAELVATVSSYSMGKTGFSGLMLTGATFMKGMNEDEYMAFGQEVYEKQIARLIYPESRALVEAHMRKGHTVAIISAATPYQVEPAAKDLGIKHVMCSHYEIENGEFTGGIIRPLCIGDGKRLAAEKLAEEQGLDLEQSFFYSDSDDDLELLEAVGHPQVLNPNQSLTEIALNRGWPIRRFRSRGRPRATDFVRSLAATFVMVPTFTAGLPIWALTGSRREAQNFSTSLFADTASALIGLRLNVRGEEHMWEQRPAVFVFNHQSKADIVIMAKLMRRDIAGIGKKEIKKIPFIGKILEFSGTVFVDRADSESAIEAMKPLVDVMHAEGKSVAMAPEGTRSITPRLGAFKKGAFHLAIQAGVPVVPVVIHNAIDVAPKGDFIFRSAVVDIDVLPPVDTSQWSADTIDEHVAEVRQMYLDTLGQDDEASPKPVVNKTRKPRAKAKAAAKKAPAKKARSTTSTTKKTASSASKTTKKSKPATANKQVDTAEASNLEARA